MTQVYFTGDPYLEKDSNSASPKAINRILPIQRDGKNEETVHFDVVMAKEFTPEKGVFEKISGVYEMSNKTLMEFYREGDSLFGKRNGQIMFVLFYQGNNEFASATGHIVKFELQTNGNVKVCSINPNTTDCAVTGTKAFKY